MSLNDIIIDRPELNSLGVYEFGWADPDSAGASAKRGINEDVVRDISNRKQEPDWMLEMRLKGYDYFTKKGVLLGLYSNGPIGTLADQPIAARIEHVLTHASKVHPQIRQEFESAYAVWWKKVPYNEGGDGLTACCHRTPYELHRKSRMTTDDSLVNCGEWYQ